MHSTTFVPELNNGQGADVDTECVPLVQAIRYLDVETLSCCQGDPGPIDRDGGAYGHIAFWTTTTKWDYKILCRVLFDVIRPMVAELWDDVRLEISLSEDIGSFIGWIRFRNEALLKLTEIIKHHSLVASTVSEAKNSIE